MQMAIHWFSLGLDPGFRENSRHKHRACNEDVGANEAPESVSDQPLWHLLHGTSEAQGHATSPVS